MQGFLTSGGSFAKGHTSQNHYTYKDYLAIDDGNRYEVIDGELVLTPSPGFVHQHVSSKIESAMLAKYSILQQVAMVMLVYANQWRLV